MKKMPLEKTFKLRVQKDLRTIKGLWSFKTNELSISGIPDILGCYKGNFIALELKRDITSKPTELQEYVIQKIKEAGGFACVVCPQNWEQVFNIIKEM
jgi:hypothetical protein